jgi:hypothetical protein
MLLTTTILDLKIDKGFGILDAKFIKEFLDHFTINVLGKLTGSCSNKDPSDIGNLFIC